MSENEKPVRVPLIVIKTTRDADGTTFELAPPPEGPYSYLFSASVTGSSFTDQVPRVKGEVTCRINDGTRQPWWRRIAAWFRR